MVEIEGTDCITPEKNKGGRPRKDPWGQSAVDKREVATLFAELPTGYTLKVYRKTPQWASGYLGEMFNDGNSAISLEELKSRFGGQELVIQVIDDQKSFRSQKTVKIQDVPKADYQEVNPQFASTGIMHKMNPNGTSSHPAPGTVPGMQATPWAPGGMPPMPQGLPPKLQRQIASYYMGFPVEEPKQEEKSPMEIMQQKMMMDMMNQSSNQQAEQMRNSLEMQRDMMRMRREWENQSSPQTPIDSMNNTIAMIRELKSMQGEFGSGGDNAVAEIAGQAIPAVEGLLSEIISLKKVGMQAAVAQARADQPEPRALPARTAEPKPEPEHPPTNGNGSATNGQTLEQLAAELGRQYHSLPEDKQQTLIDIFMSQSPKREIDDPVENEFDNPIETGHNEIIPPNEILDEEDRELLANGGNNGGTGSHVQNGGDTSTTEVNT